MTTDPAPGAPLTPKQQALAAAAAVVPEATGLVDYRSAGRLLLIGDPARLIEILPRLGAQIHPYCLFTAKPVTPPPGVAYGVCANADAIELEGHLGNYRVRHDCADPQNPDREFDLVLDLGQPPRLQRALPPTGYLAPPDDTALEAALRSLPDLVGRFEKPQYFRYDPELCAHGASGIAACRRCIDACPAEAIVSIGEQVAVDPHLCQGGGICAAVCPSGAMTYRYPTAADTLERIRRMLKAYREAGGGRPALLLHGAATQPPDEAPDLLPLALEELASAGAEIWLAALAYGATRVLLAPDPQTTGKLRDALEEQRRFANAVLAGLGLPAAVAWADAAPPDQLTGPPPARHAPQQDKRRNLYLAIDHLAAHAAGHPAMADLPAGAPLGRVLVDEGCTLCLACTSVCPSQALAAGGDTPALRFFEGNCVQCGLCVQACPEQVMRLEPRVLYDAEQRRQPVTLRAEEPFCCASCGKAFATRSVIAKMQERLADHWMYQDETARRRLTLCEDCRVADMMLRNEL